MSRFPVFTLIVSLTLLTCISCRSDRDGHDYDKENYTRIETLRQAKVATEIDGVVNKPTIDTKRRVLLVIRGTDQASYYALTGPKSELSAHSPPTKIPGPPTPSMINNVPQPDVQMTQNPEPAANDTTEGEAQILVGFPFLNLLNGWVYVNGFAPAAQTEHVIAGSDSTTFMVEIDRVGSAPESFVHRVYAIQGTVTAQARDGGVTVGPIVKVVEGRYIEVRCEAGSWAAYGPAVSPTAGNTTRHAIKTVADAARIP